MFPMSYFEDFLKRYRQQGLQQPMAFEGGYNPYSGIKPTMMGGTPSSGVRPLGLPNPLNALNGLNKFGAFMGQARGLRKPGMMVRSKY